MKRKAIAMLVATLAVTACGRPKTADNPKVAVDPKAATDNNFKAALQAWFDEHPDCVRLDRSDSLPIERDASRQVDKPALDAAVAAGLLSVEPITGDRVRYSPTDAGKDAVQDGDRFLGGVNLCYARRNIEAVENFTEPTDAAGMKVSRVTYSYTLKDVAAWASHPAIAAALSAIPEAVAKPSSTDADDLILTNQGWTHHRALR
ncbi:MAG: hypothetical protein QHC65_15085 [Sphingomonas sp.]|nr:hypothetical protein [Sphingomonas sp.]MDX3885744.1 hypothetical protein [Sphingomonas sp.]